MTTSRVAIGVDGGATQQVGVVGRGLVPLVIIDATYSADTVQADRDELESVVTSLRFAAP